MSEIARGEFSHSTGTRNHFSQTFQLYLLFDDRLVDPIEILLVVVLDLQLPSETFRVGNDADIRSEASSKFRFCRLEVRVFLFDYRFASSAAFESRPGPLYRTLRFAHRESFFNRHPSDAALRQYAALLGRGLGMEKSAGDPRRGDRDWHSLRVSLPEMEYVTAGVAPEVIHVGAGAWVGQETGRTLTLRTWGRVHGGQSVAAPARPALY